MRLNCLCYLLLPLIAGAVYGCVTPERKVVLPDDGDYATLINETARQNAVFAERRGKLGQPSAILCAEGYRWFVWEIDMNALRVRGTDARSFVKIPTELHPYVAGQPCRFRDLTLDYDEFSHRGKITMSVVAGDIASARVWAKRNVETLARDKNIVLTTGVTPPAGRYRLLDEHHDGKKVEICFEVY